MGIMRMAVGIIVIVMLVRGYYGVYHVYYGNGSILGMMVVVM